MSAPLHNLRCIACAASVDALALYIQSLESAELRSLDVEAVVDDLGFCAQHWAALMDAPPAGFPPLLDAASTSLVEFLNLTARGNEALAAISNRSHRACPICTRTDRAVGVEIHRALRGTDPPVFCHAHYLNACRLVESEGLMRLAVNQAAMLDDCVSKANPDTNVVAEVAIGYAFITDIGILRQMPEGGPPTCTICSEVSAAEQRWLKSLHRAVQIGHSETLLPQCGHHLAMGVAADLSGALIMKIATVQAAKLRTGLDVLSEMVERRKKEANSVFYKRPRVAHLLGQERKLLAPPAKCPACIRMAVAETRAANYIFEQGPRSLADLCLKHFGYMYSRSSPGFRRKVLVPRLAARLSNEEPTNRPNGDIHHHRSGMLWGTAVFGGFTG